MLEVSCDIETSCGVKGCPGYGLSNSTQCDHAVHHILNKIDIIGIYDGHNYQQFRSVEAFDDWFQTHDQVGLIFHGGKFDYKTLKAKGSQIRPCHVVGDTQLLGSVIRRKVPAEYLAKYNVKRKELNANLPQGAQHRMGLPLSLKTMSPYYLGVSPFWENPVNHDDPEYNKMDCVYTWRLHESLVVESEKEGTLRFYREFLLPWNKLLTEAELEGVLIDEKRLHSQYAEVLEASKELEERVHEATGEAFQAWHKDQVERLTRESEEKCDAYISKRIKDHSKDESVRQRYAESLKTRLDALPERFNLNSNDQMKFILSFYGVDMNVEKRDKETNEWIEKEGADKYVLKRAKVTTGSELSARLLSYREKQTEARYIKQYIEATFRGRIYCSFNAVGTRTGRLSSSGPNLQNVKGSLREPFLVADPDLYSIYTVDASQIEPRVVAYLTQDREMVALFRDGRDYHNFATKKFFPRATEDTSEAKIKSAFPVLRKTAKIGDLSIIYGTGVKTFCTMCLVREEMNIPEEEGKQMVFSFRRGLKPVFDWKKNLEEKYKEGMPVSNLFGRPVVVNDSSLHMKLFNYLVQGTASDMILNASLMAFREFCKRKIDAKPLMWIHDEVVWRFPKGQEEICRKVVDWFMTHYKLETREGLVPLACDGNLSTRWEK